MTMSIVLLHGWGFTPMVWAPVVDALVQRGVDREVISVPPLPLASGDMPQTLDALTATLPKRAHVVGWSLGGELALALTHRAPEQVATLTLIASTPCFMNRDGWVLGQPESLLDDFDQRLTDNPAALLKRFSMLIRHGDAAAGRDRALAEAITQASESAPAQLAGGLRLLRDVDLRANLATPATSTQLIHGALDAVVPVTAAAWLAEQMAAPLQEITGASHALPLTHAAQLADLVHGFIRPQA